MSSYREIGKIASTNQDENNDEILHSVGSDHHLPWEAREKTSCEEQDYELSASGLECIEQLMRSLQAQESSEAYGQLNFEDLVKEHQSQGHQSFLAVQQSDDRKMSKGFISKKRKDDKGSNSETEVAVNGRNDQLPPFLAHSTMFFEGFSQWLQNGPSSDMDQTRGRIALRIPKNQDKNKREVDHSLDFAYRYWTDWKDYWTNWQEIFREQREEHGIIMRKIEHIEQLMDPLEALEQEIWKAYGLDGKLEPDRLFKECQRRAHQSSPVVQRSDDKKISEGSMSREGGVNNLGYNLEAEAVVDGSSADNRHNHRVMQDQSHFHFKPNLSEIFSKNRDRYWHSDFQLRDVPPGASQDEQWVIALDNLHTLRHKKFELLSSILQELPLQLHFNNLPDNPSAAGTMIKQNAARFWAVVIGIDFYAAGSNLDGAVNDAKLVYDYLRQDLGVPESNIKLLLQPHNSSSTTQYPTRAGILDALYTHLRDNTMVTYGDNIFIYFAGHGSLYRAAHDPIFTSIAGMSGTIEAICPADHYMEEHLDDDYTQVAGIDISDRELNIILSEIGKKHGNHITVILDCCHSGGMARSLNSEQRRKTRYLGSSGKTLSTMLAAADRDPRRHSDSPRALNDRWCFDFSTHVMIGACQDIETANEFLGNGIFTMTFLNALRSSLGRNPDTTYNQLIDSPDMRLPFQTPVIAGSGQNSTLWFQDVCSIAE